MLDFALGRERLVPGDWVVNIAISWDSMTMCRRLRNNINYQFILLLHSA